MVSRRRYWLVNSWPERDASMAPMARVTQLRLLTSASARPAETASHRAAALPPDPIVLDAAAPDRSAAREAAEPNEPRPFKLIVAAMSRLASHR
jgi:hypothetical protein